MKRQTGNCIEYGYGSRWKVSDCADRVTGDEKATARLKCGKAAGTDGITPRILKYKRKEVVEWMFLIYDSMEIRKTR